MSLRRWWTSLTMEHVPLLHRNLANIAILALLAGAVLALALCLGALVLLPGAE